MHTLKIICGYLFFCTTILIAPAMVKGQSQCMMVVTYSEMASAQFKKAYKATSAEEARKFLKKGMDQVQQAASYAPQCACPLAETYALEAYTFGKKGFDTAQPEDMKRHAKQAMNLSIDAMAAAQQCTP